MGLKLGLELESSIHGGGVWGMHGSYTQLKLGLELERLSRKRTWRQKGFSILFRAALVMEAGFQQQM